MKLIILIAILFLVGCASDSNTIPSQPTVTPQFQSSQSGFQTIPDNQLTLVEASYLSIGDYTEYNSSTSTWTPNVKGDYYIDSQVLIQGTYKESVVTAYVVLMYENQPYYTEPQTFKVPKNKTTQIRITTNGIIPFNGITDSVSAWVYVSSGVNEIVSEQSQFEGYYIGNLIGTPIQP